MINLNDAKSLVNYLQTQMMKMADDIVIKRAKKLGYCKIVYGQIQQYNKDNSYDTTINGATSTIYAMNDDTYKIGDTVIVLVLNNTNYSNRMILCKRPANII